MRKQNTTKSVRLFSFFICICLLLLGCGGTQISRGTDASSETQYNTENENHLLNHETEEQTIAPITPTSETTEVPTAEPTREPTPKPTKEPTPKPTEEPTEEPTAEPTEKQTPETTEEPTPEPTKEAEATPKVTYIVNTNTKKFHRPGCSSVKDIKESNRWDFTGSREELIEKGYVPCKRCNP